MSLRIYNVLTRQKEAFVPLTEGKVNIYVCGPTVYDNSHIGHAKTYVSFDVIIRYLRYRGYDVLYVQNITDVGHMLDTGEDRILRKARQTDVYKRQLRHPARPRPAQPRLRRRLPGQRALRRGASAD